MDLYKGEIMTKEQREKRVSDESIKDYYDKEEWEAANHVDIDEFADDSSDPVEILCERESREMRKKAFKSLMKCSSERDRVILSLYYIYEFKIDDIAEIFQTSNEMIENYIKNAKAKIRENLVFNSRLIEHIIKTTKCYNIYYNEILNEIKEYCQSENAD